MIEMVRVRITIDAEGNVHETPLPAEAPDKVALTREEEAEQDRKRRTVNERGYL